MVAAAPVVANAGVAIYDQRRHLQLLETSSRCETTLAGAWRTRCFSNLRHMAV